MLTCPSPFTSDVTSHVYAVFNATDEVRLPIFVVPAAGFVFHVTVDSDQGLSPPAYTPPPYAALSFAVDPTVNCSFALVTVHPVVPVTVNRSSAALVGDPSTVSRLDDPEFVEGVEESTLASAVGLKAVVTGEEPQVTWSWGAC